METPITVMDGTSVSRADGLTDVKIPPIIAKNKRGTT
jgi:hypothetical protein